MTGRPYNEPCITSKNGFTVLSKVPGAKTDQCTYIPWIGKAQIRPREDCVKAGINVRIYDEIRGIWYSVNDKIEYNSKTGKWEGV